MIKTKRKKAQKANKKEKEKQKHTPFGIARTIIPQKLGGVLSNFRHHFTITLKMHATTH